MLKEENSVLNIDINSLARPCDNCCSAACTVYCRAEATYLCTECDSHVHSRNQMLSRHERVWVCAACGQSPAAFLCKADSASLCVVCDADIHSANPLAHRHHRVPILSISGGTITDNQHQQQYNNGVFDEEDDEEAASWLLPNPVTSNTNSNDNGGFFSYADEYLDLGGYTTCQDNQLADQYDNLHQQQYNNSNTYTQKGHGNYSVVPIPKEIKSQSQNRFVKECDTSKIGCNYPVPSNYDASVSSMDVGVVPESVTSDVSISQSRPPKGTIDLFSGPLIQMPTQLSPMDREARVLRYREKKKTRKFEKTIRYASRKAYAETRPRIKGRFAKRTDVEVDQMFSESVFTEGGYGIVHSY